MARVREWFVCDNWRSPCVYDGVSASKLKSDPLRCIQHGALLFGQRYYNGMTREQVRKELADEC